MQQFTKRPIEWPHGKAVAVCLTIECDGELFWTNLNPAAAQLPKTLSLGTYGIVRGVPRTLQVLKERGVRSSWFVPGLIAEQCPGTVRAIADAGHEVAGRAYAAESFRRCPLELQRDLLRKGADALEKVVGVRPAGFRAYQDPSEDTPAALLAEGYSWSSNLLGDDRPTRWATPDGSKHIIEIPFAHELRDFPQFGFNFFGAPYPAHWSRIAEYDRVLQDWKDEFDARRNAGLCYVLTLEPQIIGTPGRADLLRELLDYILSFDDVWVATGAEIAEFWRGYGPEPSPIESEPTRLRARPLSADLDRS